MKKDGINKRREGMRYEQYAAAYLKERGYHILEMNYHCRIGEIDIVAEEGGYLVFVEVKYRSGLLEGMPEEAVDKRKQKMISRVALCYCMKHGYAEDTPCRFDVVAILKDQVHLIQNAFEYQ